MTKASPIKTSFNAGEWSPLLSGHINLEKFPDSCLTLQNMIALKQGPTTRRGGTKHIKEVKNSSSNTVLLSFDSGKATHVIEAGDTYFRFYKDEGAVLEIAKDITDATQADPIVITSDAHGYSDGDEVFITGLAGMTELNDKYYLINNSDANTFELQDIDGNDIDGTGYTAYTSGGTVARTYEITSPYSASDLLDSEIKPKYQYVQSADVMFIAQEDYNIRSLSRVADTNWAVVDMAFNDGPYLDENTSTTTLTLSATTGSVSVTASAIAGINNGSGFLSTDVGRLIRFKDPANKWTWLKITAVASTTSITATILGANASAGTATTSWRLGVYSETTGYPRTINFFQDRIVFGGTPTYPDRFDMSRTGGYSNTEFFFAPSDIDGTVTDDAAISITLASSRINDIQFISTDERGLIIGTAGAEWIVRASTNGEVLTPSNVKADQVSTVGSAYIQPVQAESGTVFIQRARKKIHDIVYSFEADQLKPRDLSIFAEHINNTGIAECKFQQEPINVIWNKKTNGNLVGMTYYPEQNVWGFHRHIYGGNAMIKSITVVPSADKLSDQLYLIASRTINGVTRQYIESQQSVFDEYTMDKRTSIFVDSALTLNKPLNITGATQAVPCVLTIVAHGLSSNDYIDIEEVNGMTELNGNRYKITVLTDDTVSLQNESGEDIDSSDYTEYTSSGIAREAVTSVGGLEHLEGEIVKVMLDGNSHPDLIVTNGRVTFANSRRASIVIIGLANTWRVKTQRLEAGAADGTAQGKTKRITRVVYRLLNTLGFKYGLNENSELDEYDFNQGASYNERLDLFSGDTESLLFPEGYETDGTLYMENDGVFNATILAIMPQLTTQDR